MIYGSLGLEGDENTLCAPSMSCRYKLVHDLYEVINIDVDMKETLQSVMESIVNLVDNSDTMGVVVLLSQSNIENGNMGVIVDGNNDMIHATKVATKYLHERARIFG